MRLSKEQWLSGGLDLLVQAGPDAIKLDKLCKHMGVTKGSFYHHFGNRDQFVAQLLAYWAEVNTDLIIRQSSAAATVESKRQLMNDLVQQADFESERAIRGWSCFDEQVRQAVSKVDQARIAFIASLMAQTPHNCASERDAAELIYGTFIGFMQLPDAISRERGQFLEGVLARLLLPR